MKRTVLSLVLVFAASVAFGQDGKWKVDLREGCPHGDQEPPKTPPLTIYPLPGWYASAKLAGDGIVVNDTNASHIIVLDFDGWNAIQVVIWEPYPGGGAREVLRARFATADVMAKGGVVTVYAQGGDDVVRNYLPMPMIAYGGKGDDELYGGSCNDILLGGYGADDLYGHGGCDLLEGGDGDDLLVGGGEVDRIRGGDGNDILDALEAPWSPDYVNGGPGLDAFITSGDLEEDFDPTEDY